MGKTVTKRVNDTIDVIRRRTDLPGPILQQIVTLINAEYPRGTPDDREVYAKLSEDMSVKHNGPGKALAGHSPDRERRRAIFLLWMVMAKRQGIALGFEAQRAQQAMTMGVGALDSALSAVMRKAAVVAGQAGAEHVFLELLTHPVRFLRAHRIAIFG